MSRKGFGVIYTISIITQFKRSVHFGLYRTVEREREKLKREPGIGKIMQMGAGNRSRQRYSYFLIAGDGRKGISFAPEISRPVYSPRETKKSKIKPQTKKEKVFNNKLLDAFHY
jgi:hypothetical protein